MLLDSIKNTKDIKTLDIDELNELAMEIRNFLIKSISETGGHFASNLGTIEMTIALHYCLNLPEEKIVWDVGHQGYTHKLLTGRKGRFKTLRKLNGMSGFPSIEESEYDSFGTGHSTTSISAGLGIAIGKKIKDINNSDRVVVVIGDGSLTGGMAYEAINHAVHTNSNLLIILNDNQMSISENVGGVSKKLNKIRLNKKYISTKKELNDFLNSVPLIGNKTYNILDKVKNFVKQLVIDNTLFDNIGIKYFGVVDGHDIKQLVETIESLAYVKGPMVLHIATKKGKGYRLAERYPTKYHGVPAFNSDLGIKEKRKKETYSKVLGDTLIKIGKKNDKIVTLTSAMAEGTGLLGFKKKYPKRFIDVGIAEEHCITLAGGLSVSGIIPVVVIYSTFLQRGYDQLIHDICLQKLHVLICIDRAGIVGEDGATHQGIFDIAFLNHIPNITIIAPSNKEEFIESLNYGINTKEPICIRYPKGTALNTLEEKNIKIKKGNSNEIYKGEEACIISVGTMLEKCSCAYEQLKEEGISCALINLIFVKPIDENMIKSLDKYKVIVVVEDGIKRGGVSSIILEYLNDFDIRVKVISISYADEFIEHGTRDELMEIRGLTSENIINQVKKAINFSG